MCCVYVGLPVSVWTEDILIQMTSSRVTSLLLFHVNIRDIFNSVTVKYSAVS